jgi:hypothetical protein
MVLTCSSRERERERSTSLASGWHWLRRTILLLNVRPIEGVKMVYDSSAKVYDLPAIDSG